MSIFYLASVILLFILVLLVKKRDEKQNFIVAFAITSVAMVSYHTLCCYVLNLFEIQINLIILSSINVLLSICLTGIVIKQRKVQSYSIDKKEGIVILLFAVITIASSFQNFGKVENIKYVSMDSRIHYIAARQFSETGMLLNRLPSGLTGNEFMPLAYTNEGILFQVLKPWLGEIDVYKVFIGFEIGIYFLSFVLFYMVGKKWIKGKWGYVVLMIMTIFYALGYPYNSMICGFHYLTFGLLEILAICYFLGQWEKKQARWYEVIFLFLFNLGLMFSYCLFCPFVYLAEAIYLWKKRKEKGSFWAYFLFSIVLPGIIGITFLFIPKMLSETTVQDAIATNGWVYANWWSNFIIWLPFACYAIYQEIKQKKTDFLILLGGCLGAFLIAFGVYYLLGKCSTYYLLKLGYVIWLALLLLTTKTFLWWLETNKKIVVKGFLIFYLLFVGISVIWMPIGVEGEQESLASISQIYRFNYSMVANPNCYLTEKEIQVVTKLKEITDVKQGSTGIMLDMNSYQKAWIEALTGYREATENMEYYVLLGQSPVEALVKQKESGFQLVYENEVGKIYKKT